MKRYVFPAWDRTNIWEVSGRQSVRNIDSCVIAITQRHHANKNASGSGRIRWEDLERAVSGRILGIFSKNTKNIYILTDYEEHTHAITGSRDNLSTKYTIVRTGDAMCSAITPGLLKAIMRKYITNAKGISEKPEDPEQLKCQSEYPKGGKGEEERGYIAWRSRVF